MQLNLGQRLPCAHQKNTNTCARSGGLAALGGAAGVRAAAARFEISSPPNAAHLQASMANCFSTSSEETSRKVLCARARRRAEITATAPAKGVLYLPRRARCHLHSLCGRQSLSPLACSGEAAGKRRDYAHAVVAATLAAADELRTQKHPFLEHGHSLHNHHYTRSVPLLPSCTPIWLCRTHAQRGAEAENGGGARAPCAVATSIRQGVDGAGERRAAQLRAGAAPAQEQRRCYLTALNLSILYLFLNCCGLYT